MDLADGHIAALKFIQSKKINEVPTAISILSSSQYTNISPTHLSEALNGISGVNIHRGSGQEHLTSIRSPVLTGGSGAGSFLYMEDGVPLRAAGFSNVNGLFEASPEFSNQIEVLKGPGPVQYGSNAVHGLINFQNNSINNDKLTFLLSEDGYKSLIATTSSLPVDVSVSISHDNGFREESGFDQQKLQLKYFNRFNGWNINWLSSFNNLNQGKFEPYFPSKDIFLLRQWFGINKTNGNFAFLTNYR